MSIPTSGTLSIYQIASNYVGEYMYAYGFTYSGTISDLYNLNYFRGKVYYYSVSARSEEHTSELQSH